MSLFKGAGVAIVTPFTDEMEVNFNKLEELIDNQINNNMDCILICGTTGESSTLTDEEHLECINVAVQKTNGRVPVIAGTGSNDTRHGIELSKKAEKLGADGLLVVTPYYNKTTQKGLVEYYTDIAKSVNIPLMLYNVPSRTGVSIEAKTVAELAKIDNITALKEASGDIAHALDVVDYCDGNIDIYSGNDDQVVPLLSIGGKGVISVVGNILPKETHDMVAKYLDGDQKGGLELQLKLLPVIRELFSEVNPIPVKEALNLLGYNVGPCRKPLTSMVDSNKEQLKKALINYGLNVIK
ncbi:MAG: 4-hydroxy-tetrahydrodipicolinate synthase [Eubacteriales bacterium]